MLKNEGIVQHRQIVDVLLNRVQHRQIEELE